MPRDASDYRAIPVHDGLTVRVTNRNNRMYPGRIGFDMTAYGETIHYEPTTRFRLNTTGLRVPVSYAEMERELEATWANDVTVANLRRVQAEITRHLNEHITYSTIQQFWESMFADCLRQQRTSTALIHPKQLVRSKVKKTAKYTISMKRPTLLYVSIRQAYNTGRNIYPAQPKHTIAR